MTIVDDQPAGPAIRHRDGDDAKIVTVPEPLGRVLAPATRIVFEWTPYLVACPGASELRVGSTRLRPLVPDVFALTFENQLGLATLRGFDPNGPVGQPLHVEVIAAKFATADSSVAFLRATLDDLFARIASAPFALATATERMVRESPAPPNALFAFHFFRHHGPTLGRAVQAVLGRPHQRLVADPVLVRPHEARHVDHEAIGWMLRAGHPMPIDPGAGSARLTPLQRLRPERVWQHLPIETFDTPENRFVLEVCRRMLSATHMLRRAAWYAAHADPESRRRIEHTAEQLAILTLDDRFATLGPLTVAPAQSRVLQRRDGYREIALLWQLFQRSRRPLFERLQHAIALRNVAELYEFWVWFELIDRIAAITGASPEHLPVPDVFGVPGWRSRVRFGTHGTLHYNRSFTGYSRIGLRPDFVWERAAGDLIVMDAKFRMQRPAVLGDESDAPAVSFGIEIPGSVTEVPSGTEDAPPSEQHAKDDDVMKMHAYRDAIRGVRAAVALYPGNVSVFRDTAGHHYEIGLNELLTGTLEGVGAFPMGPITNETDEEAVDE